MSERREEEGQSIVIIADGVDSTRRLRELLTRRGFSVLPASSQQEALDILGAGHADLVLLDAEPYVALQQRADRLAAINRLTRVIGGSFDLDEVYQAFAAEVRRLIQYDRIALALRHDAGPGLRVLRLAPDQPAAGWPESVSGKIGRAHV